MRRASIRATHALVIVGDMETVPERKAAQRMHGPDNHAEEDARSMRGTGFAKHSHPSRDQWTRCC